MIAYISGRLINKNSGSVIIENNGIGYEVFIPLSTLYNLPDNHNNVTLYIYTYLKDETLTLFGFYTLLEKRLFLMLISVAGIGPRLAINILSGIGPEELLNAIAKEDVSRLCRIPGIGKKTAQRIVLELKEKSKKILGLEGIKYYDKDDNGIIIDAISALVNLGYSEDIAERIVKRTASQIKDLSLEVLIKESLKTMSD